MRRINAWPMAIAIAGIAIAIDGTKCPCLPIHPIWKKLKLKSRQPFPDSLVAVVVFYPPSPLFSGQVCNHTQYVTVWLRGLEFSVDNFQPTECLMCNCANASIWERTQKGWSSMNSFSQTGRWKPEAFSWLKRIGMHICGWSLQAFFYILALCPSSG